MQLLWSNDPSTQTAILVVLGAAALALLFVYGPAIVRLVRIVMLERAVHTACQADERSADQHREEMETAFAHSPLAAQFEEFYFRWKSAQADGPQERSPVRLIGILEEQPLLPNGPVRSLLPALPGLFLAIGIAGTFVGLTAAVSDGALAVGGLDRDAAVARLATQVGLALRTSLWGLMLAILATAIGRVLEGGYDRYAGLLDRWVERLFGAVSPTELANMAARSQRQTLEQLGSELTRFTIDLTERVDRGLQRIEVSTSSAANLVSEEQRGVLKSVVRDLSLQIQQGVEQHLGALHGMLERAVAHQGAVTDGISEAFEQMAEQARSQTRVTQVLDKAASSVQAAAASLSRSADDFDPVLSGLRDTGASLQQTATSMESTQHVVARSASGVRSSLEHATAALNEQRDFIESGLGEIRATLESMDSGLGENLNRALRNVDDSLERTVGRLRETINESNETIDRMTVPIRSAESAARELHTVLDRVRSEITGLGDWLGQSIKPLRATLTHLEDKTSDVTRALIDYGDHSHRADKTMDALRAEIHEEGRKFRTAAQELGRVLAQNAEAVSALEKTTAEADRRGAAVGYPALDAALDLLEPPTPRPRPRDAAGPAVPTAPLAHSTAPLTDPAAPPPRAAARPAASDPRFDPEQAETPPSARASESGPEPATDRDRPPILAPSPGGNAEQPPAGEGSAACGVGEPGASARSADAPGTSQPDLGRPAMERSVLATSTGLPTADTRRPEPPLGGDPHAGLDLGPDPYTRPHTEGDEPSAHDGPAAPSAPSTPAAPAGGEPASFAASEDLSLSGLLRRNGAERAPDASGAISGSELRAAAKASEADRDDPPEPTETSHSSASTRRARRNRRRG